MITTDAFKEAMAAVCAPVTVMTTSCDGDPFGTTVSAFWSLSLQPPMVGLALGRDSELLQRLRATGRLGVNLLADGQQDLALNFARKGGAKFDGISWTADAGLPRLTAAPVWLVCDVQQFVSAGDHVVVVAGVAGIARRPALPLVYAQRSFGTHSGLKERTADPAGAALTDGCYA
ncbi:MAG TPA: flavin reductase family protein [Trebonia sp.]|jgi:flavin reductase (DIM6/NTAB) family NADH-FMN oxidoreductase RutF|nr:flavin reductase family protein [Trebonia sp.]